jgi:AraC-like DNA-binding protein
MAVAVEPLVSTQVVRALVVRIREHGLPLAKLLTAADIKLSRLDDVNDHVPLRSYVELFEAASELAQDPLLGLAFSAKAGPETLGAVGFLMVSSDTLGQGLSNLCRYVSAVQDGTDNAVELDGELALITYQISDDRIAPRRQDAEYSLGVILRLIRAYAGGRCEPVEVHLEHGPRGQRRAYEHAFACPVFFGQTRNAIVLKSEDLGIRSPALSDALAEVLEGQLRDRVESKNRMHSFADRVAGALTPTSIQQKLSFVHLAQDMRVSPSTLYRRLSSEKKSFRQVLDYKREAMAKRLLANSQMSIAEVASAVGYAENASFTRAFRRWTNCSPRQFRDEVRVGR